MSIETTINEIVEKRVQEEMSKYVKQKEYTPVHPEWLKLRKEIYDYCQSESYGLSFSGVQNSIYHPIKFALGLKRIDTINSFNVGYAREIFEKIKEVRNRTCCNVDVTSITSVHDKEGLRRLSSEMNKHIY